MAGAERKEAGRSFDGGRLCPLLAARLPFSDPAAVQRMRSEQAEESEAEGPGEEAAPQLGSLSRQDYALFSNKSQAVASALKPPPLPFPWAPTVYSQIRSLRRAGVWWGWNSFWSSKGGPATQTRLSHRSLFPEPGYCRLLWILSQFSASPTLGVCGTSLRTSPWKQEPLHPSQN